MSIDFIIQKIQRISLSQMDGVKLMNRTDRKFWFHRDQLPDLLEEVAASYYILEIDGERNMYYSTIYYDTERDEMYGNHHRGKLNRYKIRRRNYHLSNSSFLEVKFKNNRGQTQKVRQSTTYLDESFDLMDKEFVKEVTPYSCDNLKKSLENRFRRLMLVSKQMNERCTIDSELQFTSEHGEVRLEELVVVEVKSEGRSPSAIIDALRRRRIKSSGFSKYCIGRSMCDGALRQNNFKSKHRAIERVLHQPRSVM